MVTKLKFHAQTYDASNNFNVESAITDKSTFIAPVSGLYHFDARCRLFISSSSNQGLEAVLFFYVNGNEVRSAHFLDPIIQYYYNTLDTRLNEDIHLNAGDKLDVRIFESTFTNMACNYHETFFSGHLVFAD